MKYVRGNARRRGGSKEAIIRQRIETARAPIGAPWQKLPDGTKGNAVDQWAWDKFKESGYKTYPSELERMSAVDNGTVGRFIESRGIITIESREIVFIGKDGKEVEIEISEQKNTPEPGAEWKRSQESLKRLMDEAQEKRDHENAISMIISQNLPATDENYQKCRDDILRQREIKRVFENHRKEK